MMNDSERRLMADYNALVEQLAAVTGERDEFRKNATESAISRGWLLQSERSRAWLAGKQAIIDMIWPDVMSHALLQILNAVQPPAEFAAPSEAVTAASRAFMKDAGGNHMAAALLAANLHSVARVAELERKVRIATDNCEMYIEKLNVANARITELEEFDATNIKLLEFADNRHWELEKDIAKLEKIIDGLYEGIAESCPI